MSSLPLSRIFSTLALTFLVLGLGLPQTTYCFPTDPPRNVHFGALSPSPHISDQLGHSCGWTSFLPPSTPSSSSSSAPTHEWISLSYLYPDLCNQTIILYGAQSFDSTPQRQVELTVVDVNVCTTQQERDVGSDGWGCSSEDIRVSEATFEWLFPEGRASGVRKSKSEDGKTVKKRVLRPMWEVLREQKRGDEL